MTRPVQCVDEQALGEVLALPETDPRRRHVDECPRCRALVLSYRQFLAPSTEETASYGTAEHDALTAFRERMLGLASASAPAPAADSAARGAAPERGGGLFGPAMRPVWAVTALVVAFGLFRMSSRPAPESALPPAPTLRGGPAGGLLTAAPVYGAEGLTLAWNARPEADRYELRFFSSALAELGRRDAGHDTTVTLALADLPELYRAGDVVLWRVVAFRGGDELEASAPASLKKP